MPVNNVPSLGWNKRGAAVSVLLVLEEQRRRAGQRALVLREARGWNQEDLAHHANLSVKTVSRFENGKHEGRSRTVRAIAEALGVTEEEITGPPPAPLGLGTEAAPSSGIEQRLTAIEEALRQRAEQDRVVDAMLQEQTMILREIRRVMAGLPDDETLRLLNEGARQLSDASRAAQAARAAPSTGQAETHRRGVGD